jgi:pyruvate/2-oxoglutarate dehydrogenase complex dihydrolipoamide acyltransferase (E2) component
MHSLNIAVGGIYERLGYVGGKVEKREYLALTVTLDHDVEDGAPATRFVTRRVELLEEGQGLPTS